MKCTCNHCSVHLEFDPDHIRNAVTCPACGMETVLYAPSSPQIAPPVSASPSVQSVVTNREWLRAMRVETCYRELRSGIRILFWVLKGSALVAIIVIWNYEDKPTPGANFINGFYTFFSVIAFGIFHALHELVSSFVDVADCAVLVAKERRDRK